MWNTLRAVRVERGGQDWMKECEEMSERTYLHDSLTDNSVVMARGKEGLCLGGGRQRGGMVTKESKWGHL